MSEATLGPARTITYDPRHPETLTPDWRLFFQTYSTVARVTAEEQDYYVGEILVYFFDGDQPFPLQSLRRQSPLRRKIFDLMFAEE